MGRHSVWELVFLMVILKIPIVYLCFVVYYAIRATRPPPRRFRPGPHGGPARSYPRTPRTAAARADADRR